MPVTLRPRLREVTGSSRHSPLGDPILQGGGGKRGSTAAVLAALGYSKPVEGNALSCLQDGASTPSCTETIPR